ncbi:hypothetical protein W2_gp033c [Caulobacter phage W2]|uniref:Uncharacterized protein n=1 Tax=Caulobacter phage TMCBR4 TaxID=3028191 RepID=A0AAF0CD36_9CAUD|nr:hypothetical protein TMCBR4_gp034c [Caulobacter phage TMCBR4]WDS38401.1 hypothetical protein W2_gp033c [Caulobacter phage W2]
MVTQSHPFPFGGHVVPPSLLAIKGHLAVCGDCGARDVIKSRQPQGIPAEAVAKKLRQLGWDATSKGKNLRCPACTGYGKPIPVLINEPRASLSGLAAIPTRAVWSIPCEASDHRQPSGVCCRSLTLEITGRWPKRADGSPMIPDREVEKQAKRAKWEVLPKGGLFCPEHRKAFVALGAIVAASHNPEKACRELMKPDRGRRVAMTMDEAKALLREADEEARRVWGEDHVINAIAKSLEYQDQQQQRKEETMAAADSAARIKEPTRDQKRAINAKLTEVHNGQGYADAWTDEKVAESLGVPRAWVTEIRDEFHGPAVNEAAARERAKKLHELHADMKTAKASLRGLLDKVAAAETTLDGLETRLAALEAS